MRNVRNRTMPGHPVTAQRRLLLSLIHEAGDHIDARELHRLARQSDTSVSLATVYRSLRLFQELGLIEERRLGRVGRQYEVTPSHEHQHFVCCDCGAVIEFRTPLVRRLAGQLERSLGCQVTQVDVCFRGRCRACETSVNGRQGERTMSERTRELEAKIADLKGRMPEHSVKPAMVIELEELEDALDAARREETAGNAG